MNKAMKSRKLTNEELKKGFGKKKWKNKSRMDSQKSCGSELKKRYRSSFYGLILILLLLQFRVLSYFDWMNLSDGIIKS